MNKTSATPTSLTSTSDNATTSYVSMSADPKTSSIIPNHSSDAAASAAAEVSGLREDYQLALSLGAVVGICVFLLIIVALLVYRKNQSLQMTRARQKLDGLPQKVSNLRQVTFNRR